MHFELLDHPADIGFRVYAASLKALFPVAAEALISLILDPSHIERRDEFQIRAEGLDFESLLVNWLNEILYFTDSKRMALGAFEILEFNKYSIECLAQGESRDTEKHPAKLIVKAVTYHQLKITKTLEGWSADVYVDI